MTYVDKKIIHLKKMNKQQLQEIAALARLRLEETEVDSMLEDFNKIVNYVDKIKELDTSSIREEDIYLNHENSVRPDKIQNSFGRDEIAKIAPQYEDGFVIVPRVIET